LNVRVLLICLLKYSLCIYYYFLFITHVYCLVQVLLVQCLSTSISINNCNVSMKISAPTS
jgi:hypothetical protein